MCFSPKEEHQWARAGFSKPKQNPTVNTGINVGLPDDSDRWGQLFYSTALLLLQNEAGKCDFTSVSWLSLGLRDPVSSGFYVFPSVWYLNYSLRLQICFCPGSLYWNQPDLQQVTNDDRVAMNASRQMLCQETGTGCNFGFAQTAPGCAKQGVREGQRLHWTVLKDVFCDENPLSPRSCSQKLSLGGRDLQ